MDFGKSRLTSAEEGPIHQHARTPSGRIVPSEVTPMSALIATAYTRFVQSVRDLEGVKLHAHEAETLRSAADARLFGDEDAALLLGDAVTVLALLESAGRLETLTVKRLRKDLDEIFAVAAAA